MARPLDLDRTTVEPRTLERPTALVSVDLETDYGTGVDEALSQVGQLLEFLSRLDVPLTAFVEGQFFEQRKPLCRLLIDAGVDVQLHCYDHAQPGDTPESLKRGALALADLCGRPAAGYRAHTYRLTHELYEALLELGFLWDSSVVRGLGRSGIRHPAFRTGDYFILDGRLFEFPIATFKRTPVPLNHPYRLLLKPPAEALLWATAGPGKLVAYNLHMVDLVRTSALSRRRLAPIRYTMHRYKWAMQGKDTFRAFERLILRLRRRGYEFLATDVLYRRLAALERDAGPHPSRTA